MLLGHDRVRELAIRSDSSAHAESSALPRPGRKIGAARSATRRAHFACWQRDRSGARSANSGCGQVCMRRVFAAGQGINPGVLDEWLEVVGPPRVFRTAKLVLTHA